MTPPTKSPALSRRSKLALAGSIVAIAVIGAAPSALGQSNPSDTRPTPQDTRPPYVATIATAPTNNPDPARTPAVVPPTANVAGVQVTTAAPTTAAPTTVAGPATVKSVAATPTASVLGVTVEEQVEDVAFSGSESGRYSALGLALTAVGASLITVTRRRKRA